MKKYKKMTVTLAHDVTQEELDKMANVIYMIKGVIEVKGGEVKEKDYEAYTRAKLEYRQKLWEVVG